MKVWVLTLKEIMKATHKQIVNIYKRMGYCVSMELHNMQVTEMFDGSDYITIKDSVWYNGRYKE